MKYFELVIALICWAIRRFGIFSRVRISTHNPRIRPWVFSGGKVNKTDVCIEVVVENDRETDVMIRSIELNIPASITESIGRSVKGFVLSI